MCVIVKKPAGISISKKMVEKMWKANSDGAGIAWFDRGVVQIEKGLMELPHLLYTLRNLDKVEAVIHFRYATHGGVHRDLTHPFVIDRDRETVLQGDCGSDVLVHNGVISGYGDETISDTAQFITDTLAYVPHLATRLDVLRLVGGSKFAYLDGSNEEIHLIGNFHKLKNSLMVSNLNWEYTPNFAIRPYAAKMGYTETARGMAWRYQDRHLMIDGTCFVDDDGTEK